MVDERKFSRARHAIKLAQREAVERHLLAAMRDTLREVDPTAYQSAVDIIAELTAIIGSQLLSQTQAGQRALITLKDDVADYGTEFVAQLMAEANKDVAARVKRTSVVSPSGVGALQLADDWAGPVAGPSLIERHFGIPRSTLYRWQKRNEVVALNTRTSKKPVFPLRQFVDGRPANGIADLLKVFGDHRAAWQWLMAPSEDFDGAAPVEALLAGRVDQTLEAARRSA